MGERVYDFVVPWLARGLAEARGLKKPSARDLADTYEMALTVLFRLLFIAYAEDTKRLPYETNDEYRARSLKTKARELARRFPSGIVLDGKSPFDADPAYWTEVSLLFEAIRQGKKGWGVPAYGGTLFSDDPDVSRAGALLAEVELPDTVMGVVLWHLLVIDSPEGWGPVDFRSLSVREFGTIYEGLLESELSVAEVDLTTDREGYYRPCRAGEAPTVKKGRIYLHNRSGARKSSGTYFTKEFAVDHLLEHALEPALADHVARLEALPDDTERAAAFFDFRVADIAMGSGHFLVAAVDRIERALARYLGQRPLPGVRQELLLLRRSAERELGDAAAHEIEDDKLLRRLIARRCVYGVDLNPIAVNLARLSVWIHTFVPGLPLSLLDHNLVCGNSLVGIGRVAEIEAKATADATDPKNKHQRLMFAVDPAALLGAALEPLHRLARIADSTPAEVDQARKAMEEARVAVRPAEALCDIVTACRMTGEPLPVELDDWERVKGTIVGSKWHKHAQATLAHLPPFHFPIAFPEVFLRQRSGFDVILGNPPWEKARIEEHVFWARHEPGLRSLSQRQYEKVRGKMRTARPDLVELLAREVEETSAMRQALLSGPYPGMGTGDPDLFKAFCWRFWQLITDRGGWMGVVLPRTALAGKGLTAFRLAVFEHSRSAHITMLVNNRQWVFDSVHPQYTIGLVAVCKHEGQEASISLLGPFSSEEAFAGAKDARPQTFSGAEVCTWTDTASLPLLPTAESLEIFAQMRNSPRMDLDDAASWRVRPYTELHASADKHLMDLTSEHRPRNFWPVFKGESFDIWTPDTGRYYAWADPKAVLPELQAGRLRAARSRNSAWSECDPAAIRKAETYPALFARIAFRDVSRATDGRTVRVALVPPRVFVNHLAPVLLFPRGDESDMAFVLGILASIPLDWYARRFVETHLTYAVLNPFPIPRPSRGEPLRERVVQLAGRLAAVDERFAQWAGAVGVEYGPLPEAQKRDHIHELDAVVAHLYGLSEAQLTHVFETFHEGWDYHKRLAATVEHYRRWRTRKSGAER